MDPLNWNDSTKSHGWTLSIHVMTPSKKKKKKKKKCWGRMLRLRLFMSTPLTVMAPSKANAEKGRFVWTPFVWTPLTVLTPSKTRQTRHPKPQWLAAPPNFRPHQNLVLQQLQERLLGSSAGWGLGCHSGTSGDNLFQTKPTSVFKNDTKPQPKTKQKIKIKQYVWMIMPSNYMAHTWLWNVLKILPKHT